MRVPFAEYVERELDAQALLINCGLPATNKTETSELVVRLRGFTLLRSDLIRKEVLAGEDIFDEKVAASMDKRVRVYDEMFRRAEEAAAQPGGVILDATFVKQELRLRAAAVAARHGRPFVIHETRAPRDYSIQKILKRTKENYESNALTEQAYDNNVAKFERIDAEQIIDRHPELRVIHVVIDTGSDDESEWAVAEKTIWES
ncbi:MAG: ATP-binding protein [Acidobacteriota bacterium]|nr:MAG: ATP-binding protein [Acidobacteriota bacterium]